MRRLISIALLFGAAATARAADGPLIAAPAAGERLVAGSAVTVRWGDVPAGAEEQELLLSLDGGRHYRLVTRRLDSSARAYRWIVPELLSGDAVLALRVGDERREVLVGQSATFTIEGESAEARRMALAEDPEETSAPLPNGWEGPIPLTDRNVRAAWTAGLRFDAAGVVPPREIFASSPPAHRFLEFVRPLTALPATGRSPSRSADYPRRL